MATWLSIGIWTVFGIAIALYLFTIVLMLSASPPWLYLSTASSCLALLALSAALHVGCPLPGDRQKRRWDRMLDAFISVTIICIALGVSSAVRALLNLSPSSWYVTGITIVLPILLNHTFRINAPSGTGVVLRSWNNEYIFLRPGESRWRIPFLQPVLTKVPYDLQLISLTITSQPQFDSDTLGFRSAETVVTVVASLPTYKEGEQRLFTQLEALFRAEVVPIMIEDLARKSDDDATDFPADRINDLRERCCKIVNQNRGELLDLRIDPITRSTSLVVASPQNPDGNPTYH